MPRTRTKSTASAGERTPRPNYTPGLEPVDREDIPERTYRSKAGDLIREFDESDMTSARVTDASRHFNVRLREFINKNPNYAHIEVITSGGETYLSKADENGEVEDEPTE